MTSIEKTELATKRGSATLSIVNDLRLQIRQQQEAFEEEKAKIIQQVFIVFESVIYLCQYEEKLKSQQEEFELERQQWIKNQLNLSNQLDNDEEWITLKREDDQKASIGLKRFIYNQATRRDKTRGANYKRRRAVTI